jgi:ribosomal protein S18 acetylase RimI-like enzyme
MKFTTAKSENLPSIMRIIHDAQIYLASQDIDQWQNGYPNEESIHKDISQQESFIVSSDGSDIIGTAMFTTQAESTYANIEGFWLTKDNAKYGVIHRMAVGQNYRKSGIAKFIFNQCEQTLKDRNIASMRIDTHEDNKHMQGLLKNLGYTYCGVIFLDQGEKRLAFEKLINLSST